MTRNIIVRIKVFKVIIRKLIKLISIIVYKITYLDLKSNSLILLIIIKHMKKIK